MTALHCRYLRVALHESKIWSVPYHSGFATNNGFFVPHTNHAQLIHRIAAHGSRAHHPRALPPPTGTLSTPLRIAPMWLRDVHAATVWEPQGDGHLTRQHDSYPLPGTDTIRAARAHRRRNEATSRGVAVPLRLGGGRDVSEVDRPGE